jgi:hypothetical protein
MYFHDPDKLVKALMKDSDPEDGNKAAPKAWSAAVIKELRERKEELKRAGKPVVAKLKEQKEKNARLEAENNELRAKLDQ